MIKITRLRTALKPLHTICYPTFLGIHRTKFLIKIDKVLPQKLPYRYSLVYRWVNTWNSLNKNSLNRGTKSLINVNFLTLLYHNNTKFLNKSVVHRKTKLQTSKSQKTNVKPSLNTNSAFHRKN